MCMVIEKCRLPYHIQHSTTALFSHPITRTCCLSSPSSCSSQDGLVEIYDDVITAPVLKLVDICASAGGLGHAVYLRTASDSKTKDKPTNCSGGDGGGFCVTRNDTTGSRGEPATPIEAVIESILSQMSDNCSTVEYWWRDEWISLDAHADIDEKLATRHPGEAFRYPRNGHVLYLFVGREVQAPTVIWTGSSSSSSSLEEVGPSPSDNHHYDHMYTVPAVASRLLRFQGSLLHGVPRPALRYMDMDTRSSYGMLFDAPDSRRKHLMQDVNSIPLFLYNSNHSRDSTGAMTRSSSQEEMDGGPSMTSLLKYRRSVLLFNTWMSPGEQIHAVKVKDTEDALCGGEDRVSYNSIPIDSPIGIDRLPPSGTVSHYRSMEKEDHVAYLPLQHCTVNSNFVSNSKLTVQHDDCFGVDSDSRSSGGDNEESDVPCPSTRLKVGLLGDRRRRLTSANYFTLQTTSKERAVQAFLDRCYPTVLPIYH